MDHTPITQHKSCSRGFTMTEILIVTIMIGILAALILPRLVGQTEKARAAEAVNIMGAIARAQERFRDQSPNNNYFRFANQCANLAGIQGSLGLDLTSSCNGAAGQNWQFVVTAIPGPGIPAVPIADTSFTITATRMVGGAATNGGADFIRLISGTIPSVWNGGGTFAGPADPGGPTQNWPNLQ